MPQLFLSSSPELSWLEYMQVFFPACFQSFHLFDLELFRTPCPVFNPLFLLRAHLRHGSQFYQQKRAIKKYNILVFPSASCGSQLRPI
jgi:hypothetical protein